MDETPCKRFTALLIGIYYLGYNVFKVNSQCNGAPLDIDVGYQSGQFSYPPNAEYGTNLVCKWRLQSRVNAHILYRIHDVGIDCSDMLEVTHHINASRKISEPGRCTSGSVFSLPLTISRGQSLSLKFKSDGTSSVGRDKGFSIEYISSSDLSFCFTSGETSELTASTTAQTLTSPKFPNNYENNWKCHWIISPSNNSYQVTLNIQFIEIDQANGNCYDHLKISYDGFTDDICGSKNFFPLKSYAAPTGQNISITFISDDIQTERGFLAVYKQTYTTTSNPSISSIVFETSKSTVIPDFLSTALTPKSSSFARTLRGTFLNDNLTTKSVTEVKKTNEEFSVYTVNTQSSDLNGTVQYASRAAHVEENNQTTTADLLKARTKSTNETEIYSVSIDLTSISYICVVMPPFALGVLIVRYYRSRTRDKYTFRNVKYAVNTKPTTQGIEDVTTKDCIVPIQTGNTEQDD